METCTWFRGVLNKVIFNWKLVETGEKKRQVFPEFSSIFSIFKSRWMIWAAFWPMLQMTPVHLRAYFCVPLLFSWYFPVSQCFLVVFSCVSLYFSIFLVAAHITPYPLGFPAILFPPSFQMLISLFPVVLLSARVALVDGAAAPPLTFTDTDPMSGKQLECDRCPPGTYLRARCTSTRKSECAPCPQGSFTELWNYIDKCLRCGVCGQNQVEKTACSADSDCQCECKQGYYYKQRNDMCLRHSECPPGQEVLTKGRLLLIT